MDPAFQKRLLSALQQRIELVADRAFYERDPSGHLAALQTAAAQLDRLIADLPASTDPMLRHYLERQSYLKAISFLSET